MSDKPWPRFKLDPVMAASHPLLDPALRAAFEQEVERKAREALMAGRFDVSIDDPDERKGAVAQTMREVDRSSAEMARRMRADFEAGAVRMREPMKVDVRWHLPADVVRVGKDAWGMQADVPVVTQRWRDREWRVALVKDGPLTTMFVCTTDPMLVTVFSSELAAMAREIAAHATGKPIPVPEVEALKLVIKALRKRGDSPAAIKAVVSATLAEEIDE